RVAEEQLSSVRRKVGGTFDDLLALEVRALHIRLECLYQQLPRFSDNHDEGGHRNREYQFEVEELAKKIRQARRKYRKQTTRMPRWRFVADWLTRNEVYPPERWQDQCSTFSDIANSKKHALKHAFQELIRRATK